ncbi:MULTISPECIES: gamma carbonic anhydrase family protein [unclassified Paenibacillus]|uniref:gamma carbonic anhydrase family protein n=1 Tax=unclassified Paenibacillus TaxID=185978 RepID=UPI001AE6B6F0|nr:MULTISPECIES: gamma carbonic anhydrase family protein [unclassified Paenibacillus]MBP1155281.1 carbonic anhydrase/acetyltransferase-like protein (isoleucine patch superfamily) [Paenibacillus sp. PvP091]MBP1169335.1 carbonic anhydrase/acetyltransferase-like protein (isoleucine patch superfamily) [Paenibacillus sp. PvR098]MBP2440363.1 carbonic anhydrase/acetyltransferase-like protein (isoleucine patch superfamily) [Paenibacillus sp. PvP052]
MLHSYNGIIPQVHPSVFLAPGVQIIGDVVIEEGASIWYNTVLRGDLAPIRIGKRSNIQDGCIGHVNSDQPLIIEDEVSVGHGAIIHGCHVGKGTLIGMGAIVLNGANIGEYALIGAGTLVTENKSIPSYTLSLGSPSKVVRELLETDLERMKRTMESYCVKGSEFLRDSRKQ